MRAMNEREQIRELGLRTFPLNGKVPPKGFHWKEEAEVQVVRSAVYAIVCDQVAVADTDTREQAVWWWENRTRTPWLVKTPRGGIHFYYKGSPDLPCGQYDDWDLRAGCKGYVAGPGSVRGNVRYELIGAITLDLPAFDPEWIPEQRREKSTVPLECVVEHGEDIVRRILRARAFIKKIFSIEGEGGDKGLFRAASALTQKFELPAEVALEELRAWNAGGNARPAWPDSRLVYKIEESLRIKQ